MEGTAGHSAPKHLPRLQQDAHRGSPLAQYLLGAFYELGETVSQDHTEAAIWYERAADQGLAVAQFALGAMYARGEGVPGDVFRAHMWLSLSATHAAQINGGEKLARDAQQLRDDVSRRMTSEQMLQAEQLARVWSEREAPIFVGIHCLEYSLVSGLKLREFNCSVTITVHHGKQHSHHHTPTHSTGGRHSASTAHAHSWNEVCGALRLLFVSHLRPASTHLGHSEQ